jgi:hypothetical protein
VITSNVHLAHIQGTNHDIRTPNAKQMHENHWNTTEPAQNHRLLEPRVSWEPHVRFLETSSGHHLGFVFDVFEGGNEFTTKHPRNQMFEDLGCGPCKSKHALACDMCVFSDYFIEIFRVFFNWAIMIALGIMLVFGIYQALVWTKCKITPTWRAVVGKGKHVGGDD